MSDTHPAEALLNKVIKTVHLIKSQNPNQASLLDTCIKASAEAPNAPINMAILIAESYIQSSGDPTGLMQQCLTELNKYVDSIGGFVFKPLSEIERAALKQRICDRQS